ncbi:MAG: MmgE/PrpD family protein [Candidatus Bathyarchaeota archaeon]|nr:MmgE/PrpD family protein [Candidatus Bathyarchaeota archaeon]
MVKEVDSVLRVGKELTQHIVELSYDELPHEVTHQTKRVILDSLGTIYMGTRKEEAAGVTEFLKALGAPEECTVIGSSVKTSLPWAAWANAAYAQVHDCNDGHRNGAAFGGSAHPGRVAIPAALALGEKLHASGRDVITAIVVGYDVAGKIRGMKDRPPASAYCSAAIASRMLGLNADETTFALGIAGFHSPKAVPRTMGLDVNFLSNGYQAKVGIEAALLAKQGFNGPKLADDNRISTRFKTRGLGEEYEVMNVYIKPWPTCRMTHGAIEALLTLRERHGFTAEDIDEVEVSQLTHGMYINDEKVGPDSYYKNCQFNLPYIAACTIIDGTVTEAQFTKERIADEKIHELAGKVKVKPDEGLDSIYPDDCRPTTVTVKLKDGKTCEERVDLPWGEPRNPLTDDELFTKFADWSSPTVSPEKAGKIWDKLQKLDKLDCSELLSQL